MCLDLQQKIGTSVLSSGWNRDELLLSSSVELQQPLRTRWADERGAISAAKTR